MIVNLLCRKCLLRIQGGDFLANLMLLAFYKFDIILGMDWLTLQNVVVNCRLKQIDVQCQSGEIITVKSDRSNCATRIILTISLKI